MKIRESVKEAPAAVHGQRWAEAHEAVRVARPGWAMFECEDKAELKKLRSALKMDAHKKGYAVETRTVGLILYAHRYTKE